METTSISSPERKSYSDFTPEQKEKHKQRTLRWRALNRERHLASQARRARERRARNPQPATPQSRAKKREYARLWRLKNPSPGRAAAKRWREKNKERVKLAGKHQKLKAAYGLTIEQFNEMIARQNNACAICEEAFGSGPKDTHVDHCHATGRVRSILCNGCNNMLGRARDRADLLRRGAEYLDRWSATGT